MTYLIIEVVVGIELTGWEIQILPGEDNHVYLGIEFLCKNLNAGHTVEKSGCSTSLNEYLVGVHKKTGFREDIGVQVFIFGAADNGTFDSIKDFLPACLGDRPQSLDVVNLEADFKLLLWPFKANTSFSLTVQTVRLCPSKVVNEALSYIR